MVPPMLYEATTAFIKNTPKAAIAANDAAHKDMLPVAAT